MAIRLQSDGIKVHSRCSMSQGLAVGQKYGRDLDEYGYSKPLSRKDDRLNKERKELTILLEDAEDCMGAGRTPWFKHEVMMMWCERTGRNERQFRRRLSELSDRLRAFYERLPDRRFRTVQVAD